MGLPIISANEGVEKSAQQTQSGNPHLEETAEVALNLKNVKRVVGVHSGKGGVGKTFVAVNLAYSLAAVGKKVGLLDADIDCPNVIRFLNIPDQPLGGTADGRIFPLEHKGVKVMSSHLLTDDPAAPMIVRGPIKHKVLAELLSHVDWGDLDVLVCDLPPGTSDVPMSTMLIGGLTGVVVVTTPQKEAMMDARKSALMARDLSVPVLGVLENMSGEVFGSGGGERLALELGVPYLGSVPLSREIRSWNEDGSISFLREGYAQPQLLKATLGEPVELRREKRLFRWPFGKIQS